MSSEPRMLRLFRHCHTIHVVGIYKKCAHTHVYKYKFKVSSCTSCTIHFFLLQLQGIVTESERERERDREKDRGAKAYFITGLEMPVLVITRTTFELFCIIY